MKLQITIDGKIYEAEVEVVDEDESPGPPSAPYQPPPLIPQSAMFPGAHPQSRSGYAEDAKTCRSPVMGLVIRVNVVPGQVVQPGDLIMVLESMKMETNVTAPRAGTVKNVNVAPGDSVKLHQTIVEFQ